MKKIFLFFACVFCASAAFAAPATIKNTMKMVAYFPVPYVAYDTVSASQSLDLGILNKCELALGENKSNLGGSNCALFLHGDAAGADDTQRGLLNVSSGKLDLNATGFNGVPLIKSNTVLVGMGGQPGYGWLDIGRPVGKSADFDALYVASLAKAGNSLRATQEASVPGFKMFDEIANDFPECGGTVTWQELELGADETEKKTYKDIYLVCGEVVPLENPCEDEPKKTHWNGSACVCPNTPNPKREDLACPESMKGTRYRVWNDETCSWDETNNCTERHVWKKVPNSGFRVDFAGVGDRVPCESPMGLPSGEFGGQGSISSCQSIASADSVIEPGEECFAVTGKVCFESRDCLVHGNSQVGYRAYGSTFKCE